MNAATYTAFIDEFTKIAVATKILSRLAPKMKSFSLAGEKAIVGARPQAITGGGVSSAGELAKTMREANLFTQAAKQTESLRHTQLEKLFRAGEFDPKTHSMLEFMRTGKVLPRSKPVPMPSRISAAEQPTAVLPRPSPPAPAARPRARRARAAQSVATRWWKDPRILVPAAAATGAGVGAEVS